MPGHCIIRGANLYISREDKDWICTLLGGADFDDSVVVIPILDNQVLIYRNPNQFGEWLTLEIQETDHFFPGAHAIDLPKCQRWNVWPEEQTMAEAKQRIHDFWEYMNGKPVEECLLSRVPESMKEKVDPAAGPITELYNLAKEKIDEAEEAIRLYTEQVKLPDIFMGRSKLYPVAKELRAEYGKAVSQLINRADCMDDQDERNDYFKKHIDKINAHIRGSLIQYSNDEQKLIIKDLAHLCYVALPGSGNDEYTLTQANDGILGIPSSKGERNLGTAHIFIDLLLDLGIGIRIEKDENTNAINRNYRPLLEIDGELITLVGSWRRLAERDGLNTMGISEPQVKKYTTIAYNRISRLNEITVADRSVTHDSKVIGYTSQNSPLPDGNYTISRVFPALKSILLQVIPSA